ncbi:MAG: WYL domain-containing protein [Prevotella sp.]|nr:WYL domain-containing protein [Prevotella sp.]
MLDLLLTMVADSHSAAELAEVLGTSKRNLYYVIKQMEDYGFVIHHLHRRYLLDPHSPFFQDIARTVDFTQEQAFYMYRLLSEVDNKSNPMAGLLRRKLTRYYHLNEFSPTWRDRLVYNNVQQLQRAVNQRRVVVLHGYSSGHSQTVKDRLVEPFLFLGDKADIRAYEPSSGLNKTFKISRIAEVEVMNDFWQHEDRHRQLFTDMFMFSSEERISICLCLDLLAHSLMCEEYPHAAELMKPDGRNHWVLTTDVANYVGIGRFILGLYDHVEIVYGDGLKRYLRERLSAMSAMDGPQIGGR